MLRKKKLSQIKKTGFTLVELLVVIAIIGILAAAVMVSVSSARAKARDARRLSDADNLRTALEMYYDQYNSYPDYSTDSAIGLTGSDVFSTDSKVKIFLPTVPRDPRDGKAIPGIPGKNHRYYYWSRNLTKTGSNRGGKGYTVMVQTEKVQANTGAVWTWATTTYCISGKCYYYAVAGGQ